MIFSGISGIEFIELFRSETPKKPKTMKKITFIAAFILLSQSYAGAQAMMKLPPEERAANQTEWMRERLNLNPDQVQQVREINLRYSNKMQDIFDGPMSKPEKNDAAKALFDKKSEELEGVFTERQYSAYKAKENDMKGKMKKQLDD